MLALAVIPGLAVDGARTPARTIPELQASIDLAPMPNVMDRDLRGLLVDFIYNSVVPDSDSIEPLGARQLDRLNCKRIGRQCPEAFHMRGTAALGSLRRSLSTDGLKTML